MAGLPPRVPRLGIGNYAKPRRRTIYNTRAEVSPSPFWFRDPFTGQRQLHPIRPPVITDTTGPRFPNYLPELHARRADYMSRHPSRNRARRNGARTASLAPIRNQQDVRLGDIMERAVLNNLMQLCDTSEAVFGPPHRLLGPRPFPSNNELATITGSANSFMSLYRAPDSQIREWESGTPMLQLDLMRRGEGVGPTGSQLPSPESSHDVGLSIRGHRHRNSNIRRL